MTSSHVTCVRMDRPEKLGTTGDLNPGLLPCRGDMLPIIPQQPTYIWYPSDSHTSRYAFTTAYIDYCNNRGHEIVQTKKENQLILK